MWYVKSDLRTYEELVNIEPTEQDQSCWNLKKTKSADFLLQNKKHLPKGIYADKEYSEDVEHACRKLHPIMWQAKQLPEFKMKSKLEGDKLVIKGRSYTKKNLHLLPEPLTGYKVSSKEDDKSHRLLW